MNRAGSMVADRNAADELDRRGLTLVGRVPSEVIAEAMGIASDLLPADRADLHYSTGSDDHGYRAAVSNALGEVLAPAVAPLLVDARYVFGVFVAQRPGPGTGMGFHHDLSFTDEQRFGSVAVWIPLVDVDESVGTLAYLPGSHLDVACPRGTPTFPSPLRDIPYDLIVDRMDTVSVPAGTVVVTDPRLAHASTDNRGTRERVTAILVFTAADAPLLHHYQWADGRIEQFAVTPDFYTRFHLTEPPARARSLGGVTPDFSPLGLGDFRQRHPAPAA